MVKIKRNRRRVRGIVLPMAAVAVATPFADAEQVADGALKAPLERRDCPAPCTCVDGFCKCKSQAGGWLPIGRC